RTARADDHVAKTLLFEVPYNLCRGDMPSDRIAALKTIPHVPQPSGDPVMGGAGPLTALWKPA
ncbi:MAG: hypothetical protein WCG00_16500, partial [Hyphomicrobiales bacterium]